MDLGARYKSESRFYFMALNGLRIGMLCRNCDERYGTYAYFIELSRSRDPMQHENIETRELRPNELTRDEVIVQRGRRDTYDPNYSGMMETVPISKIQLIHTLFPRSLHDNV